MHAHDVVQGADLRDLSKLPGRGSIGVLDPEVAGEGQKIILGNGDEVAWAPPPEKLSIPDWSGIKAIRHYFGTRPLQVFPAWFYHEGGEARLMKTAEQAKTELGIFYRRATNEEKGRYGLSFVWDWADGCKWRPQPWEDPKFDPNNPGQGKTYMPKAPDPHAAQNSLVAALIPQVAEAVARALKTSGPAAPPNIDPTEWQEFLAFQAWKKAQETVQAEVAAAVADEPEPQPDAPTAEAAQAGNALKQLSADEERTLWEDEARERGILVQSGWSLEQLKTEVEKAAQKV